MSYLNYNTDIFRYLPTFQLSAGKNIFENNNHAIDCQSGQRLNLTILVFTTTNLPHISQLIFWWEFFFDCQLKVDKGKLGKKIANGCYFINKQFFFEWWLGIFEFLFIFTFLLSIDAVFSSYPV